MTNSTFFNWKNAPESCATNDWGPYLLPPHNTYFTSGPNARTTLQSHLLLLSFNFLSYAQAQQDITITPSPSSLCIRIFIGYIPTTLIPPSYPDIYLVVLAGGPHPLRISLLQISFSGPFRLHLHDGLWTRFVDLLDLVLLLPFLPLPPQLSLLIFTLFEELFTIV